LGSKVYLFWTTLEDEKKNLSSLKQTAYRHVKKIKRADKEETGRTE